MSEKKTNDNKKEDITMNAAAVKIDCSLFNDFLKLNKSKINNITPKNPVISKDDEWSKETCWDTEYKELNNK